MVPTILMVILLFVWPSNAPWSSQNKGGLVFISYLQEVRREYTYTATRSAQVLYMLLAPLENLMLMLKLTLVNISLGSSCEIALR